ncbi:MAG: M14 family zinc carboxypeptidase, partial [Thermoguttaceae bacterium]
MRTPLSLGTAAIALSFASMLNAAPPAVEGYLDSKTLAASARELAQSELVDYAPLARTLGGREMGVLTFGVKDASKKPAILVVGGIDPGRPVDGEVVLRMARQLASEAGADANVRKLLDRITVYCIVQAAPDGTEAFFQKPLLERQINARPTDDDTDGQADEDGPDDLSGDGLITAMRVEDAQGQYVLHPDDPRVMIEADTKKGERGRYRLYVEGKDNDGDDRLNEDPPGGVAFDRNFTFDYPYFQPGAGPHQVSEIETRAV